MQAAKNENLNPVEQRKVKLMRMGHTQSTIAKKLHITPAFFNKWLNGKRNSKRLDRSFELLYRETTKRSRA